MGTFRLYTGPDGQGRIEKIDVEHKADWLKGLPTSQISFSIWPVGRFLDWHPAPRRQYIINLDAGVQLTASDGESRVIGAGEVILVEDTSGKGHRGRVIGGPAQIAIAPLVGDTV